MPESKPFSFLKNIPRIQPVKSGINGSGLAGLRRGVQLFLLPEQNRRGFNRVKKLKFRVLRRNFSARQQFEPGYKNKYQGGRPVKKLLPGGSPGCGGGHQSAAPHPPPRGGGE
jgi:hypothetical protein